MHGLDAFNMQCGPSVLPSAKITCKEQEMTKAAPEWTDARLNDLAAALQDVPTQLAVLSASITHFEQHAAETEPMRAQLAVLTAGVDHLANENRALRAELAAIQLQLVQISWALVAALLGAGTAVIAALI
jgi:hypothetical protein